MELLQHPQQILAWYVDAGVDEAIGEAPLDRFALAGQAQASRAAQAEALLKAAETERAAQPFKAPDARDARGRDGGRESGRESTPTLAPPLAPVRAVEGGVSDEQIKSAVALAAAAKSVDELSAALQGFDGCPLKKSAMNLVFGAGNSAAKVVLIGDVPGADEDRQGAPFVGPGGQLLDKMLASIGLDRAQVYVANTVFWRPPGNRTPHASEVAVCLPFVERLIELIDPAVLVTLGGPATHALLAQQGNVAKLVGRWFTFETSRMSHPIAATALHHPDSLIKTPAYKRQAWQNLLAIRQKLNELGL
ncbi:MAG: uracil-DNA glycosylase [Rhodospirillales bacterium]|nr:uracil-DNA glycosylase [Rhodospirillales bacterium]